MATFTATVQLDGKTATGIIVPTEIVTALGAGRRPAVTVTINGYSYPSTIGVMGGVYKIPISSLHRNAAKVAAGDVVKVNLELDAAPREVLLPPALQQVLEANSTLAAAFAKLAPSKKKAYVLQVESAKTDETRERRIAKILDDLS